MLMPKTLLLAASFLILAPQLARASDVYANGTLTLKSPLTLTDKDSNQPVTLPAGSAVTRLTISSAGLVGSGYMTIETPAVKVSVKIPRKSYSSDTNFKAYANDTGFGVNLLGTKSVVVANSGGPVQTVQSCYFNPKQFNAYDAAGSPITYKVTQKDINGNDVVSEATAVVNICVFAPVNGVSQIKQTNSTCAGHQIVAYQAQTTTTSYDLDFVNPANGSSPVGTFKATLPVETSQRDLGSLNDCQ